MYYLSVYDQSKFKIVQVSVVKVKTPQEVLQNNLGVVTNDTVPFPDLLNGGRTT